MLSLIPTVIIHIGTKTENKQTKNILFKYYSFQKYVKLNLPLHYYFHQINVDITEKVEWKKNKETKDFSYDVRSSRLHAIILVS